MPTITDNFWITLGSISGDTITEDSLLDATRFNSVEIFLVKGSSVEHVKDKEVLIISIPTSVGQQEYIKAVINNPGRYGYDLNKAIKDSVVLVSGLLIDKTGDTALQQSIRLFNFLNRGGPTKVVWGTTANGQQSFDLLFLRQLSVKENIGSKTGGGVNMSADTPSKTYIVNATFDIVTKNLATGT